MAHESLAAERGSTNNGAEPIERAFYHRGFAVAHSEWKLNRREFSAALAASAAAWAPGAAALAADANDDLLAGAAELAATPEPRGTFLIGALQASTGVNDDLFVRGLVLAQGEQRFAILTLDYLGFDLAFTETLLAAASKAVGIPVENIMLNCSHTHSAPLTAPWGPWKEYLNQACYKILPKKVDEVLRRALGNLQRARLRYHREPTQLGFNRRLFNGQKVVMAPNPQGAVLPWVDVLSIERTDGKPIAVLFSHAAHPVVVHEASTLISADYPGFAIEALKKARGGDTVYLFAQGCCGNINGFPLKGGLDAAAAVGRDLSEAVGRALDHLKGEGIAGSIRTHASQVELPLQEPPSVEECRRRIEEEKNPERRQRLADLLVIAESGKPQTLRMPIRALAFGDLCLLATAHEPFAEYHQWFNEVCRFRHNMFFGYTTGLACYVGMKSDYELGDRGGYETSPRGAAFMFQSRLPVSAAGEGVLKEALRQTVEDLTRLR